MNLATSRLNKELREYKKQKDTNDIQLDLRDTTNIYLWRAKLKGPPDTPYNDGHFLINIDVPEDYPISPPKCKFMTKVFHPNIHFDSGEICFELLKDKWSPAWTLESVCRAILDLLSNPNADSPLNCDCGKLYHNNKL
jgi:peroxin-4